MPHEELRKIIRAGKTSFAVILPRAWLRYYKLTDKDKVRLISNSKITIEPCKLTTHGQQNTQTQ